MLITLTKMQSCSECGRLCNPGDRVQWTPPNETIKHAACSEEGIELIKVVEESRALDTDMVIPCPADQEFRPFQKAGIAYAAKRRGTIIADEMGLGKTVQAIGLINVYAPKTVLIVCPKSVILNWHTELDRWLTVQADITVVNPEQMRKVPHSATFDMLIIDEAHLFKNPDSARTTRLKKIARRLNPGGHVLALTGTPLLNGRPLELWPLLQIVNPEYWDKPQRGKPLGEGGGFVDFAWRYCNPKKEFGGPKGKGYHWNFNGNARLDELQEKLRVTCMVRRLKADVLDDLPEKQRQLVVIGEGSDGIEIADDYDTAIAELNSGVKIPFEDISRVRHEQAIAKVPAAIDYLVGQLGPNVDQAPKVIVFAHHTDVIDMLYDGLLEYRPVMLRGDVTAANRQALIDKFQFDKRVKVFIGSLKAAGVGITLTAASWVVFVELDWVPANITQGEDRAHRIGQTSMVLVQHLVVNGTLDAKMARMIMEKQELADMALDEMASYTNDGRAMAKRRVLADYAQASSAIDSLRALARLPVGGQGFSRKDANLGKSLARMVPESMSERQLALAARILGAHVCAA